MPYIKEYTETLSLPELSEELNELDSKIAELQEKRRKLGVIFRRKIREERKQRTVHQGRKWD